MDYHEICNKYFFRNFKEQKQNTTIKNIKHEGKIYKDERDKQKIITDFYKQLYSEKDNKNDLEMAEIDDEMKELEKAFENMHIDENSIYQQING